MVPFAIFGVYCIYTKTIPKIPIPKDYKETAALVTVTTIVFTLFKTRTLLFKQNIFLQDNRNEESSFIRSAKEYKELVNLLNKVKKNKELKVLLVLDELDRMHKDLLPEIIELIQLFKGLNNEQLSKSRSRDSSIRSEIKDEHEKSLISFVFSFNHDILFPVIGKSISLGDKQLYINSYDKYDGFVEGKEKDAFLNYYKLGKEFMDKYLDLSIYLEEQIDYEELTEELFKEEGILINNKTPSENTESSISNDETIVTTNNESEENKDVESDFRENNLNDCDKTIPSFTTFERELIKRTIRNYASKVEPRKIIRLKNALIMIKKLNSKLDGTEGNIYEYELKKFIIDFLEINQFEKEDNKLAYKEIASTIESSLNTSESGSEKYNLLKNTEYFLHNKN